MTTTHLTSDGEHLEISHKPAGYDAPARIRIESLDRNGTPNWGMTLTITDAGELADILEDYAKDAFSAKIKADIAAKDEAHLDPANKPASDPFAGIVDTKANDPWDAS